MTPYATFRHFRAKLSLSLSRPNRSKVQQRERSAGVGGIVSIPTGIKPKGISQVRDGKDEENKIFKNFCENVWRYRFFVYLCTVVNLELFKIK